MQNMMERVMGLLEAIAIQFTRIDDRALRTGFSGRNVTCETLILVDEERCRIEIYSPCPASIPRRRLQAMMELIARSNSELVMGHFDLHPEQGRLIMTTSIILGTADLDSEILRHLLFANWAAMDAHFPAITAVLSGAVSPKEALGRLGDEAEPGNNNASEPTEVNPQPRIHRPFGGRFGRITGMSDN